MSLLRVRGTAKRRNFRLLASFLFLAILSLSLFAALSGAARKIKVMPLGDSITGSFAGMASYRFLLWQQLVGAGLGDKVEFVGQRCGTGDVDGGDCGQPKYDCSVWSCHHDGYHGTTIRMIREWATGLMGLDSADIVLLHLGTNDISSPDAEANTDVSMHYMEDLIDSLRFVNPHVTILLCKLIPTGTSKFNDSTTTLNNKFAQIAAAKTLNQSPIMIVDQNSGFNRSSDLQLDGIHPSASGEIKMANKFFASLLPVLQKMDGLIAKIVPFTHDTLMAAGSSVTLGVAVHAYPEVRDIAFVNDTLLLGYAARVSDSLYSFILNATLPGFYNVKAVASDYSGHVDTSGTIVFGVSSNSFATQATIPQIHGAQSTYAGMLVQTTGVVTAVQKDSSGFWMQDALGDGNPLTSDAIYISRSAPVGLPSRGDLVLVRGMVQNFKALPSYLSTTRLACVDSIAVLSSNNALPTPQIINAVGQGPNDITTLVSGYNAYQGMLVKFNTTAIVSPSSQPAFVPLGNTTPGSGFYLSNRVSINESPIAHIVDYNPEVLLIGSKTMNVPQTRAQDTVALTGVVDYDKGWICIQPLPDSLNLSHSSKPVSPVSKRSSGGTLRISTFDFGGFFDTIDTWGKNDYVSTAAKYSVKIAKMTKAISQELLMPVILCAQNVENTGVLSDIAANVNLTANGKYKVTTGRIYMGFSVDTPTTPDPRGLINGFLYDTTQFKLDSIILMSGPSIDSSFGTYNPQPSMWAPWGVTSQMPAPQPLIGFFKTNGTTLVIVNACLTDKSNDNSCFATGWPFSEQSKQVRIKQAFAVRNWIDAKLAAVPSVPMMVVGEFNDYPFAEPLDGTIYPVSIVAGSATKGETVFYNAYDYLSPDSRYTCIVNGRAQMTEQVMVNSAIATYAKGIDVLHFNANFEDSFATDSTTAVRVSSHDPVEIRF